MKKLIIVFGLLTMSAVAQDIEHAPTVEQCHADVAVWYNQSKADIESISARELDLRRHEAYMCADVFTDKLEREKSFGEGNVYVSHLQERMKDFIKRHGFMQQFADEDAKGAR